MLEPDDVPTVAARSYVPYVPLGVVFAIMPWNFLYWSCGDRGGVGPRADHTHE